MKNFIKKNKWIILFLILVYGILVYCHFQTFIMNDDLPYSLFFRGPNRITNLREVIVNQIFDYSHINARIFLHTIVQTLLIFDKNLWSILNPLVIIAIICLMSYIVYELTGKKTKPFYIVLAMTVLFLLLYNYKNLIYWVAGSVNYVWVFLLILLIIVYYLKIGLTKKPILSFIICLTCSMLCEVMGMFIFILIIVDYLIQIFINKEDKKITWKYLLILFGNICGLLFIFLSPSTLGRMSDAEWAKYSLFEKLNISIPAISNNLFNVFTIYNLFPALIIVSIIYYMFVNKDNKLKYFLIIVGILLCIGNFVNSGYVYFALGLVILGFQIYIFVKNKDYKLIPIILSAYAFIYSLAVTPEYTVTRTGLHTSLLLGMFAFYNLLYNKSMNKGIFITVIVFALVTLVFELIIYSYIGSVKREREESIKEVQSGESKVLKTKIIKAPFDRFHIDSNSPTDKKYWAYKPFQDYYKLPDDIKVVGEE